MNRCICGQNKKRLDKGWLRAGGIALTLIIALTIGLLIFGQTRTAAQIAGILLIFEIASTIFYLLKGHKPRCSLRQAYYLLLRTLLAGPTHGV